MSIVFRIGRLYAFRSDTQLFKRALNVPASETTNAINNCPNNCLCSNEVLFDYKNVRLLSQFVSSQTGRIYPRTYTKICMKKQKELAKAIKRSRILGFMPYLSKYPEYLEDPNLFS